MSCPRCGRTDHTADQNHLMPGSFKPCWAPKERPITTEKAQLMRLLENQGAIMFALRLLLRKAGPETAGVLDLTDALVATRVMLSELRKP